ncbi:MAG: GntR family transcriptional regulator [Methyloligellaceae bacterium]
MIEPLASQPALIDQVHERLVAAIADGTLRPGEKLTQENIAERLGVSRQPVSHALQLLRRRGLAVEQGRRGLVVAPLDPERLRGLYQVRAALDGLAAALAARRAGAGTLPQSRVAEIVRETQDGARLAGEAAPTDRLVQADLAFHAAIYELSGNQAIGDTAREQWPHFARSMNAVLNETADIGRIWREHQEILERILAGDEAGAEQAARDHAERAGEVTAQSLEAIGNTP